MKKNIDSYISRIKAGKQVKRKIVSVLLVLSVIVSGNVFWVLHGVGTAYAGELVCDKEEHTHSDECYEKVLICDIVDVDHEHDDSCFEKVLICDKEEHVHTDECHEQTGSRHEDSSVWEATIPVLGKSAPDNLVKVALSQEGYEEDSDGYTRYGDWYGSPTGDWNGMFASFCLSYAGISRKVIPYGSGIWAWQVKLEKEGLLSQDMSGLCEGDIVLFDNDGDDKGDRCGIVTDVTSSKITVVEGDVDGKVAKCGYPLNEKDMIAFISVNEITSPASADTPDDNTDKDVPADQDTGDVQDGQDTTDDAGVAQDQDADTDIGIDADADADPDSDSDADTNTDKNTNTDTGDDVSDNDQDATVPDDGNNGADEDNTDNKDADAGADNDADTPDDAGNSGTDSDADTGTDADTPDDAGNSGTDSDADTGTDADTDVDAGDNGDDKGITDNNGNNDVQDYDPADVQDVSDDNDNDQDNDDTGIPGDDTEDPAVTDAGEEPSDPTDPGTDPDAEDPQDQAVEDSVFNAVTKSGIEVEVTAKAGVFPEGTVMKARDVASKDVKDIAETIVSEDEEIRGMVAVDITFKDAEGNEIEPAEGASVDVKITIPANKTPKGDEFKLLHIEDEGVSVVEDADVTSQEATFTTDGFSIYVLTGTGEKDKDRVHAWIVAAGMGDMHEYRTDGGNGDNIINCPQYPYVLMEGQTVTLVGRIENGTGENLHFDFWDHQSWMGEILSIQEVSSSPTEVKAVITGLSGIPNGGAAAVSLFRGNDALGEDFSIKVVSSQNNNNVVDFDSFNWWETPEIHINYGDTLTLRGTPNRYGEDYDWPYIDGTEDKGYFSDFENQAQDGGGVRSVTTNAIKYVADDSEGQIIRFYTEGGMKTVRVFVDYNYHGGNDYNEMIDHADIEIADGGVYTSVSFDVGGDNGMVKTVTEYQSYVFKVNDCTIYKQDIANKNDNPIEMHSKTLADGWRLIEADPIDAHGFSHDDYWHDPEYIPGDSQYELTSKYIKLPGSDNLIWSNKFFRYQDVDHVVFDVGLQIAPVKVEKYRWNSATNRWDKIDDATEEYTIDYENEKYTKKVNGVEVATDADLNDIIERVDSTIFDLGQPYVVDAYNKCPNHSGLDFTVHANSAAVQFGATKELTNGVLHGGDFTFELVDRDTNQVVTEVNNAEGKIVFPRMQYDTAGTYRYYIREKDESATNTNIVYDDSVYDITVVVDEVPNSGGMLIANVTEYNSNYSFKFTNHVKITLPETGGSGIGPFILGGAVLMSGAFILLMLRRRKEVDL